VAAIGEGGAHQVTYDDRGFLVARHNYTFVYSADGKLVETKEHGNQATRFVCDSNGRIVYQVL
jgi:YD repeat-containing protein